MQYKTNKKAKKTNRLRLLHRPVCERVFPEASPRTHFAACDRTGEPHSQVRTFFKFEVASDMEPEMNKMLDSVEI